MATRPIVNAAAHTPNNRMQHSALEQQPDAADMNSMNGEATKYLLCRDVSNSSMRM